MSKKKKETAEKDVGGRPTKFKEEYCEMLIQHMGKGFSFESFAGVVDVNTDTVFEWSRPENKDKYPGFSDAKKKAFAKCRIFWEKKGIDGLDEIEEYDRATKTSYKKKMNSAIWIFNMKNRFRWTDRVEVETPKETVIKLSYSLPEKKKDEPPEEK